jgi:hypothetical protein
MPTIFTMSDADHALSSTTQRVRASRVEPSPFDGFATGSGDGTAQVQLDPIELDLAAVRGLAVLMDSSFQIGPVKFGLDAVIGLVPVVGDIASLMIGLYPVHIARKHKLGKWIVLRMLGNLAADAAVGVVPVLGDAADVLFKAHLKNLRLLEAALAKKSGPE